MKQFLRVNILLILITLLINSCKRSNRADTDFIRQRYSNKTTEIIDHIFLELIRENRCYETFIDYQIRMQKWTTDDTVENNKLYKYYLDNRRAYDKKQVVLVKNELPSISRDTTNMEYLKKEIDSDFLDDLHATPNGKMQVFRLSLRQKSIYRILLDSMKIADVFSSEIVNTGCLQVQNAIKAKSYHYPRTVPYLKSNQEVCGYLTVSQAVISSDGNEACLYYEFVAGPKEGIGCILFVHKVNERWHIFREVMTWIS